MISRDTRKKVKARYKRIGSYRAVGKEFKVSAITVKRIMLDLRVKHKQKMSRKRVTTSGEETIIRKTAKRIAKAGENVTAKRVQEETGFKQVSKKTIARRLTAMTFGFSSDKHVNSIHLAQLDADFD